MIKSKNIAFVRITIDFRIIEYFEYLFYNLWYHLVRVHFTPCTHGVDNFIYIVLVRHISFKP